jgi:hypothetical protein
MAYLVMLLAFIVFTYFSFIAFLELMLYWITGLYLNGTFYSHLAVPVLLFLVYSWKNWRSFVEMKYLALKTEIHEVCKNFKEEEKKAKTSSSATNETSSQNRAENIGIDVDVESGRISKDLYDKIREKVMPYYEVLFYFFARMFFVANFCLIVFVMLLLAQKSNIAVPVQIMSTMAASTFPLIFDAIWAEHSSEQIQVNAKELHIKLKNIMKMKMKTDNIVTVEDEEDNVSDNTINNA